MTGDAYFPGGLGSYTIQPGYLVFEYGPEQTRSKLQWATYYDAADDAGQSRLLGWHPCPFHDDYDGRVDGLRGWSAGDRARVARCSANRPYGAACSLMPYVAHAPSLESSARRRPSGWYVYDAHHPSLSDFMTRRPISS